jgi:hypothetical protein
MRRIQLLALVGSAIVVLPASALASGAHHKKSAKKPSALKAGTYKATFAIEKFNITLTGGKVSLPTSPAVKCTATPILLEVPVGNFVAPAALSASGSITEQAPITATTVVGAPPLTGQSTFSVTFTKKGTASGYLEESLAGTFGDSPISCTSGKVPFTAKLG